MPPELPPEVPGHTRPLDVAGEWQLFAPEERNIWQRIAARTNGYITPANFISLAGAALSTYALYEYSQNNYTVATGLIATGRIFDLADGYVAAWTKTKGEKGALLDASLDKLVSFGAIATLACTDPITAPFSIPIVTEQIQIARTSKQIHDAGGTPTPSTLGKHAMFALSSSVGLFMLGKAVEQSGYATVGKTVKALGAVAGIGAYFLSRKARRQYRSELTTLTATT